MVLGRAVARAGSTVSVIVPHHRAGITACYPLRTGYAPCLVGLVPCLWVAPPCRAPPAPWRPRSRLLPTLGGQATRIPGTQAYHPVPFLKPAVAACYQRAGSPAHPRTPSLGSFLETLPRPSTRSGRPALLSFASCRLGTFVVHLAQLAAELIFHCAGPFV